MNHKIMSRKGGLAKTQAKKNAARENWKKALASGKLGRPRKQIIKEGISSNTESATELTALPTELNTRKE